VAGIDPGLANKALHTLEYIGLVRKEIPLFRKKGWYVIADPLLRTWYGLIEPVQSLIEIGLKEEAKKYIMNHIDIHASQTWEELVLKHLLEKHATHGYTLFGKLLHKGEEVDIALLNPQEKKAIIAEAKWRKMTPKDIEKTRSKATLKAKNILPKSYQIKKTIIAVKQVDGTTPEDTIIPEDLDKEIKC
jgi:AAA+ ATPase superfamily predicted ATPase